MQEPSLRRGRRLVLWTLAAVFTGATVAYSVLWVAAQGWMPGVELGFDNGYLAAERVLPVNSVERGSPAEQAGLRAGDEILAVNGVRIANAGSLHRAYWGYAPGDTVRLTVVRAGEREPLVLTGVFRERKNLSTGGVEYVLTTVLNFFPIPFVAIGLGVLFLRMEDQSAWLLALLFAGFVAAPDYPSQISSIAPSLEGFALGYKNVFHSVLGALFYWFFAVFPERAPMDRKAPWLKWVGLGIGVWVAARGEFGSEMVTAAYTYGFVLLGVVSLASNYYRTTERESRRKIRVLFWGTVAGLAPVVLVGAAHDLTGVETASWLEQVTALLLLLFPLAFAYAVVKHRVLEIPALIKRSARYLLVQRGFTVLLSLASIGVTLLFAAWLEPYLEPMLEAAKSSGIAIGAMFGTVLLWGGSQVHRQVSGRIDRAFFRKAYDARVILEDLVARTRTVTDRGELARLLEEQVKQALQPVSVVVYLEDGKGALRAATEGVPAEAAVLSPESPLLRGVRSNGSAPAGLDSDCVAPMRGRNGHLAGALVLGVRLSEEPYSGEDRRLLETVANHAGTALENISMAEEIAERMEAERRTAREMEVAREVQDRLLPQTAPRLRTLDVAAHCVQARAVGGDCFDFLDLGPERIGLVLADVSGKGVHAALLMANLQAYLRSESAVASGPGELLERVNRMLWKCTGPAHYATLFYGDYDDRSRRLVYVNCGHNPAVVLRGDGSVERLEATATVIGMFERWACAVREIELGSGDWVVVFSDGVPEANCGAEEFGEARLIEEIAANKGLSAEGMVKAVLGRVEEFSAGSQYDDFTVLAVRVV